MRYYNIKSRICRTSSVVFGGERTPKDQYTRARRSRSKTDEGNSVAKVRAYQ